MKRYIRSANKLSNAITEKISKKFDENEILVRALVGKHNDETMLNVFFNIMADPHVEIENKDRLEGSHVIRYDGKNIGWIDFERGMGWIDDKAYNKIQKLPREIVQQMESEYRPMLQEEADVRGMFGEERQREAIARREERAERLAADLEDSWVFDDNEEYDWN